jgi:hypothetical protein
MASLQHRMNAGLIMINIYVVRPSSSTPTVLRYLWHSFKSYHSQTEIAGVHS